VPRGSMEAQLWMAIMAGLRFVVKHGPCALGPFETCLTRVVRRASRLKSDLTDATTLRGTNQ
jgi:hypothetical protein